MPNPGHECPDALCVLGVQRGLYVPIFLHTLRRCVTVGRCSHEVAPADDPVHAGTSLFACLIYVFIFLISL